MKIVSFRGVDEPSAPPQIGLMKEPQFVFSADPLKEIPCLSSLLEWLLDHPGQVPKKFSVRREFSSIVLCAPMVAPGKIICIGKNYADHALEMGGDVPEIPVVFSKFSSALIGPDDDIVLPEISSQVDFEAELVVVIGREGKNISREQALNHVLGCCCGNDISARDWQKGRPGGQWLVGKSFDTFAPIGPWITTLDELGDIHALDIQMRLNGLIMQKSNTRNLIFPVDALISHVSRFFTLLPADLIFTGTPAGVGAGRNPKIFLKRGDALEVEIEGIGVLPNRVR